MVAGADHRELLPVRRPPPRRNGDLLFAREVLSGEALFVADDFRIAAGGNDLAAADAGTGAEIDDVVGRAHGVFVVLDDEDGVAHVAQSFQRPQKPIVVARMQTDRWLIEDVQHADQAAADLPSQTNPLRLAAGKGRGGSVQGQVMQADIK